ncbi:MAG: ATP-binding protein, partial [Actinomycetota bacterium]|nr:ATP-binding protein [Actinomycetota bacterium]
LAASVTSPSPELAGRLRRSASEVAEDLSQLAYALDKLLSRSLRGMFDGRSTVPMRWDGPGVVLDLSAVPIDSEALPLVMVAAAGWLSQLMAGPGPRRVQVIDEAWALLGNRHTARYLQTCFKLGRTYGVANVCIAHRPSDLGAQADDGTATAKIAVGLLADAATKILLRQAPDQLEAATTSFALSEPERHIVGHLARGRALWKVAGHSAVVHHMLGDVESAMCDTDSRMAAASSMSPQAA